MRRYLASLALVAAVAAPVAAAPAVSETPSANAAAVAVQEARVPFDGLRDEAAMVLVGTALIGLAAAVRRRAA